MTSIILACLWVLLAQFICLLPSKDKHWRAAYGLMAIGFPILVFVYIENGLFLALIGLAAGASILRWPVYYGFLKLRSLFRPEMKHEND